MFSYLLGNFNFDIKDNLYKDQWMLPAFVILFMVVMMILFVNFFVALMSDTFAFFSSKKTSLYLNDINQIREWLKSSDHSNTLVCTPLILNIVLPFVAPFCKIKMVDQIILSIVFFPLAFIQVLILIVAMIFTVPISYLLSVLIKLR